MIILEHDTCENAYNALTRVKQYLKEHKIEENTNGCHKLDGDDFFVNIFEYDTKRGEECIWEAHRKYYDVHYIIEGEEVIKVGSVDPDKIAFYDEERDYVSLTAIAQSQVFCKAGDLLFLDENDAHLTGSMANGKSSHVRKAVFKIRIK